MVSRELIHQKKLQVRHSITRRNGIQVHSSRLENPRVITEMLNGSSPEYHTFRLPGEEALRVMLHGISQILSTEEMKHNLTEVGYDVIAVSQIHGCTKQLKEPKST